ncbi:hypothetical protein AUK57_03105 [Candidatus Saccharibacteria bacterium CG2_30_41_52]|nr:MAG: hypothetical protein AUK57_03105 [Candidatus Saccharibacteria bacterium CG2_30_41_52]
MLLKLQQKNQGVCGNKMKNEKIVTINGQKFDGVSGLPIGKPALNGPAIAHTIANASDIHSITQKSKTLYRSATQKPASHTAPMLRKVGRSMDIARNKNVAHFAPLKIAQPETQIASRLATKQQPDIGPSRHPLAAKVDNMRMVQQQKPVAAKPSKIIKEEAIAEAFNKLAEHQTIENKKTKHRSKQLNTFLLIVSVVLLVAIGYFIYLNIPILSVRVAGAQAGISATFPEYHPDGFSLNGPVSYSDGEVTISFKSNSNNSKFVIKQIRSSWDSSAVKNQVSKDSNGAVVNTTTERGLTLYTYDGNAAWVNGGILYSISGDAHLSVDQIRRIATSL